MVEDTLADVLSDFARTMITDFPIQGILDHLVERIVGVLPVTAAGVTLIAPGRQPRYIAASDASALVYEQLQTTYDEGPCRSAYETGEAVAMVDLRGERRFPRFTAAAGPAGLAAAFAFPLRHNEGRLGALDLYRDSPGPMSGEEMVVAQTLADVTAAYVLNAQAREDARETSERFRDSSLHDALTGLPNRVLLYQRLDHAAQRAERSHSNSAVLFADLDRFKAVNDTYGHQFGDELLVAVGRRLSELVRPGDTLARVSGDEFVFLCEDLAHAADIEALARRIEAALSAPFEIHGREVQVTASVGMAFAGPGVALSRQTVVDADIAMYEAKRRGGAAHHIIDLRDAGSGPDRGSLLADVHLAVATGGLGIVYQPIVRTDDGRIAGVEALLRWTHPSRGPVATPEVIALAEDDGLIDTIGAWVLETSAVAHGTWRRRHPAIALDLAVNVSVRQLADTELPATVAKVLARTGIAPSDLVLEVTEGIFIEDGARALGVLGELRSLGVRLALDDFGAGYSSLSYLRRFPVDLLKIDQSFIAALGAGSAGQGQPGADPAATAIVRAVTDLAHALGLQVVAEGVETAAQRSAVLDIGCDFAQGHHFARPLEAAALDALLAVDGSGPVVLPAG